MVLGRRTDTPFDAVLIIAFGGPQGPDDIRPFLANVLRGRRVAPARVDAVAHHYELFGGVSPITALTARQAEGLRASLTRAGPALPVYVGMRNWHPFLADTVRAMSDEGVRAAVGFIAAPHRSYSSCEQYRRNVDEAIVEVVHGGGTPIEMTYVGDWHDAPGFIAASAAHVREARARLPEPARARARLVFTAHSLPVSMAERCEYRAQLRRSSELVAQAVGMADWDVAYQSRSGRPEDPWLGPDIGDYLREQRGRGLEAVVVCPIGFVCDHIEVLYDLDREAADEARALGIAFARASAVNDHPLFIEMMADVVRKTCERYEGGRPLRLVGARD